MKTGEQIWRQALLLLNYVDAYGCVDRVDSAELWRRGLILINQIYGELWRQEKGEETFVPLRSMKDPVLVSSHTVQAVMPYGVAMLLAQSEGDGDNQRLFTSLYNTKRTAVSREESRRDVLPRGSDF